MASDAADLQRALDRGEFFPVFQPIVELRTGQVTGFEMLARWRHAERGVLSPEEFVPRIEAEGLCNRMTEALLEKAFASAPLVASALHLSVNLSPVQVQDTQLPALIAACAERAGFSPQRLVLEVTESALLEDLARANAVARELKALGCRLALDDFGTGYSSLRHLQSLPFDKLKVDRSFVSSMTEVRENRKIVAAVVGLGQSLGLATVAEGVESQAQAGMLLWLGCDMGQGWLYGKPAPAEEMAGMVEQGPRMVVPAMPPAGEEQALAGLESLPGQRLAQIQAIYDGAPVGLCFLDRRLRYVSLNRRLAEMNQMPVRAHLGKTVAEMVPEMFAMVEPYIRRALAGEAITGMEVQRPAMGQGEGRTVLLSYQPARDEAGEVLGVSVAVMDVTEYKRTEQALRESIDHFRHLLELGPHVPWVLNDKGEVVEASSRWEEVTGQPLAEAMGNGWRRMLHAEDIAPTREAIRACLETGQPIDLCYRVRRSAGGYVWMRSRGSPRFDANGRIVGVYGVVEEAEPAERPWASAKRRSRERTQEREEKHHAEIA